MQVELSVCSHSLSVYTHTQSPGVLSKNTLIRFQVSQYISVLSSYVLKSFHYCHSASLVILKLSGKNCCSEQQENENDNRPMLMLIIEGKYNGIFQIYRAVL